MAPTGPQPTHSAPCTSEARGRLGEAPGFSRAELLKRQTQAPDTSPSELIKIFLKAPPELCWEALTAPLSHPHSAAGFPMAAHVLPSCPCLPTNPPARNCPPAGLQAQHTTLIPWGTPQLQAVSPSLLPPALPSPASDAQGSVLLLWSCCLRGSHISAELSRSWGG